MAPKQKQMMLKERHKTVALQSYETGLTPLEFLLEVMRDDEMDLLIRMDAAKSAAPYVHPKLASVEMKHTGAVATVNLSDDELLAMLANDSKLLPARRIEDAVLLDLPEEDNLEED